MALILNVRLSIRLTVTGTSHVGHSECNGDVPVGSVCVLVLPTYFDRRRWKGSVLFSIVSARSCMPGRACISSLSSIKMSITFRYKT